MAIIPTDPKQQKTLVAGIAALAVLYFANSFWLNPKREVIAADQATLESLEGSNRSAQLLATQWSWAYNNERPHTEIGDV